MTVVVSLTEGVFVTDFPHLDEVDRQIVAALQVNGRASWRKIAREFGEIRAAVWIPN